MKRGQRGFTLIELMVALVVSSLLVGMILAIFSRMSIAYRGQQQIAGVQQVLAAARATLEFDAKQAGFAMPQGFVFSDNQLHQPVAVTNNVSGAGPDEIDFFYGDPSTQAAVVLPAAWDTPLTVDSSAGFAINDLVVVSTADMTTPGLAPTDGNIAKYSACVVKISALPTTTTMTFAPMGHCAAQPTPSTVTMIYRFAARGYRIDVSSPARLALGALQQSQTLDPTGVLIAWNDLAYGFTDIQTSLQAYDAGLHPADTADPDTDASRDWYSDAEQDNLTLTVPRLNSPRLVTPDGLLQVSISLVARTDRNVEGIATAATPLLADPVNLPNNLIGDRPSIPLPSATDPALQGSRIYRYTTFQVDFRNLGVGR